MQSPTYDEGFHCLALGGYVVMPRETRDDANARRSFRGAIHAPGRIASIIATLASRSRACSAALRAAAAFSTAWFGIPDLGFGIQSSGFGV